ncbi:MAG TPA: hypothetical protein PKB15_02100 [Acidimicrobiia bacterium]|nr:hypothetical protein [Acidimicrobiia bacterium]
MNDDANNELNNQELTRVSNALDALQNHNEQPTNNAWEAIMEESTNRSRRVSRRTGILSAAAAAAVIIAITGGVLVVANNGGSEDGIKTVDKKKKDPVATSATIPLTAEQKLLKNSYLMKLADGGYGLVYGTIAPTLFDPESGSKVKDISSKNFEFYGEPQASGGHISFRDGQEYCEGVTLPINSTSVNLKTLNVEDLTVARRAYAPSRNKYADIQADCQGTGIVSDTTGTVTIVDTKTNKKRIIKPESRTTTSTDADGKPVTLTERHDIRTVIWIDDNRFIYQGETAILNRDGSYFTESEIGWYTADLRKTISLINASPIEGFCCGSAGFGTIYDAIVENGTTYLLASGVRTDPNDNDGRTENNIAIYELESNTFTWSLKPAIPNYAGIYYAAFGKTSQEIYGASVSNSMGSQAFGYDRSTDTMVLPDGGLLIPRF